MRNPVMVGKRVYLRPFEMDDATTLAERYATEPDTFMERGREMISEIAFDRWIRGLYEKQPTHGEVAFAVCLKETDQYIGLVSIESLDLVNRVGETGSWMHDPEYRGQGYGTEAKHLLLAYCFDRLHLRVLRSRTFETNSRSAAALIKQGYRPAGRLAYGDVKDGRFRDTLAFDITRDEWVKARGG
jgi:RimJ/RimL family protein N-acetyltransferase